METHRLRWGLSRHELARLLGKNSHSAIHRYEHLEENRIPHLEILLGYEIVFGVSLKDLLPELHREIEEEIVGRAAILFEELEGRTDHGAARKRELLRSIFDRSKVNPLGA